MALVRAADGTANLHIWREGQEYLLQKGPTFLEQWNNLVFTAVPGPPLANTRYVDLSTATLEFADETFDAVYVNHVFEHLTPSQGELCARQIFNALKPGGIWRVSVPDLEWLCQHYLETLSAADSHPTRENAVRYRWAVMSIFEQMVRNRSGGLMQDAIEQGDYDDAQLRQLFGDMLRPLVERTQSARSRAADAGRQPRQARRRRSFTFRAVLGRIYRAARTILGEPPPYTDRLDPRVTKEAVQWMYDRFSLRCLVEQAGFEDVRQMDHLSSSIPGWSAYDFDRSNNGGYPLDPSVFIEGRKPRSAR